MTKNKNTEYTIPFCSVTEEKILSDKIVIPFKKTFVIIKLPPIDEWEVQMDDIMKIDYSNIIGELLTFPVIMNRVGLLRAEMEEIAKVKKFESQVYESEIRKHYRKKLSFRQENGAMKKPTNPEVDEAVMCDKGYQIVIRNLFNTEKGFTQMDNLFWSAKDKSGKLDKIADKLHPDEFEKEIVEGQVNGMMVKIRDVNWEQKNNVI